MLPTPFPFIWVLQMLIGYSTFQLILVGVFWFFNWVFFANVKTIFKFYCSSDLNTLLKIDFLSPRLQLGSHLYQKQISDTGFSQIILNKC